MEQRKNSKYFVLYKTKMTRYQIFLYVTKEMPGNIFVFLNDYIIKEEIMNIK